MLSQAPEAPTPMRIQKGARQESNLGPTGAGCIEGQHPQRHGCSKPLEIPSDLPGVGRERERGAGATAGEMPPRPP